MHVFENVPWKEQITSSVFLLGGSDIWSSLSSMKKRLQLCQPYHRKKDCLLDLCVIKTNAPKWHKLYIIFWFLNVSYFPFYSKIQSKSYHLRLYILWPFKIKTRCQDHLTSTIMTHTTRTNFYNVLTTY